MSVKPKVHRGTEDDAEVLARLLRRFNDEFEDETPEHAELVRRIQTLVSSGDGAFFLAGQKRDDPVGFAYLQFNPSLYSRTRDAYLGELYVIPGERGNGYGRALLEAAIAEARAQDAVRISLNTAISDVEARALYESAGFTNTEGSDDGPAMLFYERDLSD